MTGWMGESPGWWVQPPQHQRWALRMDARPPQHGLGARGSASGVAEPPTACDGRDVCHLCRYDAFIFIGCEKNMRTFIGGIGGKKPMKSRFDFTKLYVSQLGIYPPGRSLEAYIVYFTTSLAVRLPFSPRLADETVDERLEVKRVVMYKSCTKPDPFDASSTRIVSIVY